MAGGKPYSLTTKDARRLWLSAQRLDTAEPFGRGPEATRAAVEHLGYVQIDTINVIERCHHHILQTRIPKYRRADLHHAQSVDKTVFEYWTHALSYIPTRDLRYFLGAMKRHRAVPNRWFNSVNPKDRRKVLSLVRKDGPISIRDIDDDKLVDKNHPWASRKPSKGALELAFFDGVVAVCSRSGMVKSYDLAERHFGWDKRPRPASERQVLDYLLDRALRAQGVISLDSAAFGDAKQKPGLRRVIEARVRRRELVPVQIAGAERVNHWARPDVLAQDMEPAADLVHLLSPFDPLIIQRKRLAQFFGYQHLFEAYVPKDKRKLGYFALPVLVGDEIVAAIDLKADRATKTLLIQKWTWVAPRHRGDKPAIEEALRRFERFQFPA